MGNYEQLKQAISSVIKTNGTQSITGKVLQNTLLTMINSLGDNYQFVGVATTATNPGTPDQNVFYLAGEGTYVNFSNLTIDVGKLGVLKWNGTWSKQTLEVGAGGGNMILDWNTDVATTRKQVISKLRKPGMQISYKDPINGWINEQYIGTAMTDLEWVKDNNWSKILRQNDIAGISEELSSIGEILQLSYRTYNENYNSGYISPNGRVTSSSSYKYSNPIFLSSQEKIEIEAYCNNAALLSKTDQNGTYYTPIFIPNTDELQKYTYIASEDEYVCVSWKTSVSIKIYYSSGTGKNIIEQINDKLNEHDVEIDSFSAIKESIKSIKFPFQKKGLFGSDGSIINSETRGSSQFICSSIINQVLSINNDIEFNVYYYNSENKFIQKGEYTQSIIINNKFQRFKILARYKDNRNITDISTISNSIIFYESNNKNIDMLRIGGVDTNGASTNDSNRFSFKTINTLCKFEILSDEIEYAIRLYSDFGELKYYDSVWKQTSIIYAKNSSINFRYKDDRVIDIEEVKEKIKITYINEPYIYDGTEVLSLKCVSEKNYNDGTIGLIKGCIWIDSAFNMYISDKLLSPKKYIYSWDFPLNTQLPDAYTMSLLPDRTILGVYRTERINSISNDNIRKNPIILRPENNIYKLYTIDFGEKFKPSGWLQNCGFMYNWKDNFFMFSEYTRPSVTKACVWKVEGDIFNPNNWKVVLEKTLSGQPNSGFKHFHAVQYDPYTGIIYAASGDDDTAAAIYVSKDNGDTFELLHGTNEKECRLLNFVFTKEKIYWASDSGYANKHFLFSIQRGEDNVMEFNTLTELHEFKQIGGGPGVATYGTVYIQSLDVLIFLDRADESSVRNIPIHGWDLTSNKYIKIFDLPIYSNGGFRCEYIQIYPKNNSIVVGYIQTIVGNANYSNNNAILANDKSKRDVKNIYMTFGRKSDGGISVAFDTL